MKVISLTSRYQNQIDGDEWFYPLSDKEGVFARNCLGGEPFLAYSPSNIKVVGLVFNDIGSNTIQPAVINMLEYLTKTSHRYGFFRYHYVGYQTLYLASDLKKRVFIFEIVAKK